MAILHLARKSLGNRKATAFLTILTVAISVVLLLSRTHTHASQKQLCQYGFRYRFDRWLSIGSSQPAALFCFSNW